MLAKLLRGTDVVLAVTGATGWLGAVALDLLYGAFGDEADARVVGYASSACELVVSDGRTAAIRPLLELPSARPAPTTLLHFAFVNRERMATLGVDAYVSQNIAITATVLDAIAAHRPRHVVVASSGAVYGPSGRLASDLRANPYGTLKHLDEMAFRAAAQDVGATCVVPRVFSVAGDRMPQSGIYALASMIAMALAGGPIQVLAAAPVYRSYCGADEMIAVALWAALFGREGTFDTCGTVVEMGELASLVAQAQALPAGSVRRVWDPALTAERYAGDGAAMEKLASEAGMLLRDLPKLVRDSSASCIAATR